MVKDRIDLSVGLDVKNLLLKIKDEYSSETITDVDGVKIDWVDSWVHLRASNTEPIIRIYAEAKNIVQAQERVDEIKRKILSNIS